MQLQSIKIADVVDSKTNPRGKDRGKTFPDLVASIKEKGVLMPILVRKVGKQYEVIAGSRRFSASKQLGLEEIPAKIVTMNDTEAREAQIVENLQREDVHPLDEGEAYRQLIEQSGYDVAAVAVKVGKSETFVRDRLVLTNLIKDGKTAFREGEITAGHAALIARLEDKQQTDAIEFVLDEYETPTTAELRSWIQGRVYADSMESPPWKGDEQMQAALGGCDECKGAGGDLFGKTASESCSNPKCYAMRIAAFIEIKKKEKLVPCLIIRQLLKQRRGNWHKLI